MCLTNRKEVQIPEVQAYKVFVSENGALKSPFIRAYFNASKMMELPSFEPEVLIKVQPESNTFFAFQNFKDACCVANEPSRWNVTKDTLLVLPVTLKNVVATGSFRIESNDTQCLDGYCPCYESKEIIVHDSPEIRRNILQKVLVNRLEQPYMRLSFMEQQALEYLKASA